MISNRFYVVADQDYLTYETDLLNLTCDELEIDSDADNDGDTTSDTDDHAIREELRSILMGGKAKGFYRIVDKQGACQDASTDHTGEHILSQPTLFADIVYFTSYQPVFGDPCNPVGNAFIYALDYSFGISAFNYSAESDDPLNQTKNIEDSYLKISGSSIPSGVRVITREGQAAGLISAGGSVSGVGEDQTTSIPGPPGGISHMLWETE
jgi:hypothetical protein